MTARELLITSATIVSLDPSTGTMKGDIHIVGDRIAAVAEKIDAPGATVVDGTEWIVVPGFVDTHRHTWQSAIRHTYADVDPLTYFKEILADSGTRYAPEDVYAGTLLGATAAVSAGTTTLFDWAHIQNSPEHADAGIDALERSGIRGVYGHGWPVTADGGWGSPTSARRHPADIRRLAERLSCSDRITLALAARGPELAGEEVWRDELSLARELGIRTSVHVGAYGHNVPLRAVEQYHRAGLIDADMTFVHCGHTSDDEFRMIADAGATVSFGVHCEMNSMGIGDIPLDRVLAAGLRPSLSGDTETKCAGDMFTQMRMLFGYYRSWVGGGHSRVVEPFPLRLQDLLEFATIEGARAVGLGHQIGSITAGKQADLVCIRATDLNLAPVSDPVAAVVLAAHEGNIDTVLIGGRIVKQGGRLVEVDPAQVVAQAQRSQSRLFELGVGPGRSPRL